MMAAACVALDRRREFPSAARATAAEAVVFSEDLASLGLATRYPDDDVSSLSRRCRSARHDPVPGISATTWAPEGLTAMHLAASHGHATAIAVLAEAGCDPDAVSASGHTYVWGKGLF